MVAMVNIIGSPSGAIISVDNKKIGTLPIYYHPFKWGKYHVTAEMEGYELEERKEFVVFKTDRKKTIVFKLREII